MNGNGSRTNSSGLANGHVPDLDFIPRPRIHSVLIEGVTRRARGGRHGAMQCCRAPPRSVGVPSRPAALTLSSGAGTGRRARSITHRPLAAGWRRPEPAGIRRQLGAAVPRQMGAQARIQPGASLRGQGHDLRQPPGQPPIQWGIRPADGAATGQQQRGGHERQPAQRGSERKGSHDRMGPGHDARFPGGNESAPREICMGSAGPAAAILRMSDPRATWGDGAGSKRRLTPSSSMPTRESAP